MAPDKPKIATCSLAGCFGCHMSLLDLDERLVPLFAAVELDKSPLDDLKHFTGPVDVGLVEGGVANVENVHVLRELRANCRVLVAVGECAVSGGIPAMRNMVPLRECLEEAYLTGVESPQIPADPELPVLLDHVRPLAEVVTIDHTLPGCPPSADAIHHFLTKLLAGEDPRPTGPLLRYD
ncbi:NADP oxidoreductase [Myxococcota bacterium]|nr:NADP oxidoreductase [Myxococcota bacterium]